MEGKAYSIIDMVNTVIAHSTFCWLPLTENWIYNQLAWQRKYRNIVLTTNLSEIYPVAEDIFVSDVPFSVPRYINKALRRICARDFLKDSVLSRHQAILLHSHFGTVGWQDTYLKNKRRHVTRFYGVDINKVPDSSRKWRERYKRLFDRCDAFLVEGAHMKTSLVSRGCPAERIIVHKLGTDVDKIPFKERTVNDKLKILIAARFKEKKGLLYAIEAISRLYNDLHWKKLDVTLVGDSDGTETSDYYKRAILNLITENHIDHIVKYVGTKSYKELIELALEHNVFLHPSVTAADGDCEGGYPVVLLDMMATGMPVVSTYHCDIPEIVIDKKLGILCNERNSDELALALQSIAERTVTFDSKEISSHIRNNYHWFGRGKELENIYDRVMQ